MYQHTHGSQRRRERERESGRIFEEIMAKYFPNLVKVMNLHIQKAQHISRINSKTYIYQDTIKL